MVSKYRELVFMSMLLFLASLLVFGGIALLINFILNNTLAAARGAIFGLLGIVLGFPLLKDVFWYFPGAA